MTDCWGGLSNRKIECQAGIESIEQALKERTEIKHPEKIFEPKVQVCGPFPWQKPDPDSLVFEKQAGAEKGEPKQ